FVCGVTGFQRGLLGQVECFDWGGWPAMVGLKLDGQLAAPAVDPGAGSRPALHQPEVNADDLPDRPLRWVGADPFGEPNSERVMQMPLEGGGVCLRRGHLRRTQDA